MGLLEPKRAWFTGRKLGRPVRWELEAGSAQVQMDMFFDAKRDMKKRPG